MERTGDCSITERRQSAASVMPAGGGCAGRQRQRCSSTTFSP